MQLNKSTLTRMLTESVLIIASILLALSADAWLDSRNQSAQLDAHLAALARDFDTMQERVTASHDAALRGVESGRRLLTMIREGAESITDGVGGIIDGILGGPRAPRTPRVPNLPEELPEIDAPVADPEQPDDE